MTASVEERPTRSEGLKREAGWAHKWRQTNRLHTPFEPSGSAKKAGSGGSQPTRPILIPSYGSDLKIASHQPTCAIAPSNCRGGRMSPPYTNLQRHMDFPTPTETRCVSECDGSRRAKDSWKVDHHGSFLPLARSLGAPVRPSSEREPGNPALAAGQVGGVALDAFKSSGPSETPAGVISVDG